MPENDLHILKWILTQKPDTRSKPISSVVHWKKQHEKELHAWSEPADMAIAGGYLAGCPAYAFAVGYWAALHRLVPDLPRTPLPALCISEKHGPHPAKIRCRLENIGDNWLLNGTKHFVTCGREADLLLVAASTGIDPDGKNQICLVKVNKDRDGIAVKPLDKPLNILPEISHGQVEFTDVKVAQADILPGDGYGRYIKPFRTIEDLHVLAAILGYLIRMGMIFDWPRQPIEQMLSHMLTLRSLASADYAAPEIHIATAGALAAIQSLLETLGSCWERVDDSFRSAWQRDRTVMNIAADARAKRLAAAWQRFT